MPQITLDRGTASLPPVQSLAGSNCGTPGVWRFAAGEPGPHVAITALIHGNEVCGAHAVWQLLQAPPQPERGSLTLLFCNIEAYARLEDGNKYDCRCVDEDLNRVWGRLDGDAAATDSCEMRRARELLAHVQGADVLLDLHSMTAAAPPLGLVGRAPKNVGLARRVGFPAWLVRDAGHAAGLRLIDRGAFADPAAAPQAVLVECGQHFSRAAFDAAEETVRRAVAVLLEGRSLPPAAPQRVLEVTAAVTIETDAFAWVREWPNMGVVPRAGTLLGRDGDRDIRTPHDDAYLVMPATERFRKRGETAVRFARRVD